MNSIAQKTTLAVCLIPMPMIVAGLLLVGVGLGRQFEGEKQSETLASAVSADNVETVRRGKSSFQSYCSACHGMDGSGLPNLGKDVMSSAFVDGLSDAELHNFIVVGRRMWDAANTTGVEMPPRGGFPALTDEEIDGIIAYLRAGG